MGKRLTFMLSVILILVTAASVGFANNDERWLTAVYTDSRSL